MPIRKFTKAELLQIRKEEERLSPPKRPSKYNALLKKVGEIKTPTSYYNWIEMATRAEEFNQLERTELRKLEKAVKERMQVLGYSLKRKK